MNEPESSTVPDAGPCLANLLEEQSARTPDGVAVASEVGELSYRELQERANRLAQHLQTLGIGPETGDSDRMRERLPLRDDDRFPRKTPFSFDVSDLLPREVGRR
jgi:hypothetical protein